MESLTGHGSPQSRTRLVFAAHPLVVRARDCLCPASTLQITSVTKSGNDVPVTWNAVGGNSYVVQASPG